MAGGGVVYLTSTVLQGGLVYPVTVGNGGNRSIISSGVAVGSGTNSISGNDVFGGLQTAIGGGASGSTAGVIGGSVGAMLAEAKPPGKDTAGALEQDLLEPSSGGGAGGTGGAGSTPVDGIGTATYTAFGAATETG